MPKVASGLLGIVASYLTALSSPEHDIDTKPPICPVPLVYAFLTLQSFIYALLAYTVPVSTAVLPEDVCINAPSTFTLSKNNP